MALNMNFSLIFDYNMNLFAFWQTTGLETQQCHETSQNMRLAIPLIKPFTLYLVVTRAKLPIKMFFSDMSYLFLCWKESLTVWSEEVLPLWKFHKCCGGVSDTFADQASIQTLTSCSKSSCLQVTKNRIDLLVMTCLNHNYHNNYQLPDTCPNKHFVVYLLQLLLHRTV